MKYVTNFCPFCKETKFKYNKLAKLPTTDTMLFSNDKLYVIVDISPLCLGHILIIPKHHYLNFYEMPYNIKKDVIKLKENIIKVYKKVYNSDVLFFEHGSAQSQYAGSSIDHAHLHCIPYQIDIEETLNKTLGKPIQCDILAPSNFNNDFSYIYLESKKNGKVIYKVNKLQHQFLRKLILEKLGDNNFQWQEKCTTPDSIKHLKQTISDLNEKIFI